MSNNLKSMELFNRTLEKRHLMVVKDSPKNAISKDDSDIEVLASPLHICEALIKHTSVNLLKYDSSRRVYFYYDHSKGIFIKIIEDYLNTMVSNILRKVLDFTLDCNTIERIVKNIKVHPDIAIMSFQQGYRFLAFNNGVLDTVTGQRLDFDPAFCLLSKINIDFDFSYKGNITEEQLPVFLDYLLTLTQNNVNFAFFIRCYFLAAFFPINQGKIFLIQGAAQSGKSKLTELFRHILGPANVVTTSFKLLRTSIFEFDNIRGKKLLIIADTKINTESLEYLKTFSSNDTIPSRRKNEQEAIDFIYTGVIMVVTNDEVQITDTSGALQRRIVQLTVKSSIAQNKRLELFESSNENLPRGLLVKELPLIARWIFTTPFDTVMNFLHNKDYIESYSNVVISQEFHIIFEFLFKYYEHDASGTVVVGYGLKEGNGMWLKFKNFVEERGYSTNILTEKDKFTPEMVSACKALGYNNVGKFRKNYGVVIQGLSEKLFPLSDQLALEEANKRINASQKSPLQLENPELSDRQLLLLNTGDTIGSTLPEDHKKLLSNFTPLAISDGKSFDTIPFLPTLGDNLSSSIPFLGLFSENYNYKPKNEYCSLFYITDFRSELNEYSKKKMHIDISTALDLQLADKSLCISTNNRNLLKERLENIISVIKKSGVFVNGYDLSSKKYSISPRLFPIEHKYTFHMATRVLRKYCLEQFALNLQKSYGMTVIDLDIKSCFFSIVTGIFPNTLSKLIEFINPSNKVSIWESLEQEFKEISPNLEFRKPLAKQCVYATLFGAARKGLVESCLDEDRKFYQVTPEEHKKMVHYEELEKICNQTVDTFMGTKLYKLFSEIRDLVKVQAQQHNKPVMGPNNNFYDLVNDYHRAWPCFIQDYEFSIISNLMLNLTKKFPDIVLLMHLHDGVHFACQKRNVKKIHQECNVIIQNCGQQLMLGHNFLSIEFLDMGLVETEKNDKINTILSVQENNDHNLSKISVIETELPVKKGRGRPPGSKNKKKKKNDVIENDIIETS